MKNTFYLIKNALNKAKADKIFIFLFLGFILPLIFLWGKFGDPIIDCGREAYIPYAMAFLDKTLFKDIICIYGPVPYYLNALAVKVLGVFGQNFAANLNLFYGIGALLSYVFLIAFYNLSKRFFDAVLAGLLSGVILFSCVFSPSISNFIFPYSYAVLYGLVFAVFHLHFLLNFIDDKNPKNLYFAAFFLALCVFSKYDFAPCVLPMLVLMIFYRKNLNFKHILRVFLASIIVPAALFILFLFQKISISDILFNFKMISNMAHSPSLQYFYSLCTGYFFDFKKTFMFLGQFLSSAVILCASAFLVILVSKIKNKYLFFCIKFLIILIAVKCLAAYYFRYIFLYIPLILAFFCIFKCIKFLIKTFKTPSISISEPNIKIYTLILFSILFSLKSLFGLFHELYGVFYLPLVLFSFYLTLFCLFPSAKTLVAKGLKAISIILIAAFILYNFSIFYSVKNYPVRTNAGTIFTSFALADSMNLAIDYFQKNNPEKSLLVLPEGLLFNFVLKKNYPYYNTSFTPLDFDAYGENYLIEQVLANLPDNILFLGRSYSDYGKPFICKDFGLQFCAKINDKYTFARSFTGKTPNNAQGSELGYQIYLFERKDNE